MNVTDKQVQQKREKVGQMFDGIAHRYDLLNHLLSAGIDKSWRKVLIRGLAMYKPTDILDVATGTADLAIMAAGIEGTTVTGCDISENMLTEGRRKILRKGLEGRIRIYNSPAESLMFAGNTFDAVMVAFGVRNFADLGKGLTEMHRVLKPGGRVHILEFSMPRLPVVKQVYRFYFKKILPHAGGMVSGSSTAYQYLPDTVMKFPEGKVFVKLMEDAGFTSVETNRLSMGIATIYRAVK